MTTEEKIMLAKTHELQAKMFDRLQDFIDQLYKDGEIDKVEYTIARDVLFDTTENHQDICDNNVAESFIECKDAFIQGLKAGHEDMRNDFPGIDSWDTSDINSYSHEYRDCVYYSCEKEDLK
ncbi:hypothetical protein [Enterococcus sp. AZ196]|uniref:hypothetical protein n=1 Tax=Enterococcus sp. AZ196 TaxID=2774659 RepID=UPI003D283D60